MKPLLCSFAFVVLSFSAVPVQADARGYCEDYARDVASNRMTGSAILTGKRTQVSPEQWSAANAEILADCLATFEKAAAEPETPLKPQKKKVVNAAAAAPSQDEALKPGSDAWNDYCAKKYVSFDRKTGTYTGKSGTRRTCLVTKN